MANRKSPKIPGLSFSWKRATGVTKAKRKIAKFTGIPTTKQGRRNKAMRIMTGGGCLIYVLGGMLVALGAVALLIT